MRRLVMFTATVMAIWIAAHLSYAFVMLEWSSFTEWEPISRALVGGLSVYCGGAMQFFRWSKRP